MDGLRKKIPHERREMDHIRKIGPEYFDDSDRTEATAVGVDLVNAFIPYGILLDAINVKQVCDDCHPSEDSYRIDLGLVSLDTAREMTGKLRDMTQEFSRLHELTANVQVDAEPDKPNDKPQTGTQPDADEGWGAPKPGEK
ncbi:hypothetical protein [Streptomyces griseus]|uniref:hypothetical protein n=1 Tax=Streptomyces griseus TaxID=1911 RepID=UPI00368ECA98